MKSSALVYEAEEPDSFVTRLLYPLLSLALHSLAVGLLSYKAYELVLFSGRSHMIHCSHTQALGHKETLSFFQWHKGRDESFMKTMTLIRYNFLLSPRYHRDDYRIKNERVAAQSGQIIAN